MLLRLGRGRWFVRRLFEGMRVGLDEQEGFFFLISYFLHGLLVKGMAGRRFRRHKFLLIFFRQGPSFLGSRFGVNRPKERHTRNTLSSFIPNTLRSYGP